jgi:hypothetical protein
MTDVLAGRKDSGCYCKQTEQPSAGSSSSIPAQPTFIVGALGGGPGIAQAVPAGGKGQEAGMCMGLRWFVVQAWCMSTDVSSCGMKAHM